MNTLQLQIALANELPELLTIVPGGSGIEPEIDFYWLDSEFPHDGLVTPREWDWIVRECEKKLTEKQKELYLLKLERIATTGYGDLSHNDIDYLTVHATAAQRAEAFLRTLNLWEETK